MRKIRHLFFILVILLVACAKPAPAPVPVEAKASESASCDGAACKDCKHDCMKGDCKAKHEGCACKGCSEKKDSSCGDKSACAHKCDKGSCKDGESCGKGKGGCIGKTPDSIKAKKSI